MHDLSLLRASETFPLGNPHTAKKHIFIVLPHCCLLWLVNPSNLSGDEHVKRFTARVVRVIKVLKFIAPAGEKTKCKYFPIEHSCRHGFRGWGFFRSEKKTLGNNTVTTHTHAHAHKLSNVLQCYRIRSLMKFVEMYTDHTQTFAEYVSLVSSINMSCFTVKTYHFVFSYLEDLESLHLWPFVARPLPDIKVKYLLTGVGVKIRPDVTYWELPFLFTISSSFFFPADEDNYV